MLCFRLIGIGKTPVHRFSRLIHLDMDDIDGHRTLPDRCPQHLQVDLVLHRFPPYGTHKKSMYKFFLLYMPAQKKENEKDPSATLGMTIRKGPPHSFSSRLGSEPPPLRGTSFRGKEGVCRLPPHAPFPHLNTRTGWRPVRAVFLESSEWSSHKTIGL